MARLLFIISLLTIITVLPASAQTVLVDDSSWVRDNNVTFFHSSQEKRASETSATVQYSKTNKTLQNRGNNWFLNPPESDVLNKIGHGFKNIGKAALGLSKATVKGAAVGAYVIAENYPAYSRSGYTNPSHVWVNGYTKSNGTYVRGYYRTAPNHTKIDNFSTIGNTNPYTGKAGWLLPY